MPECTSRISLPPPGPRRIHCRSRSAAADRLQGRAVTEAIDVTKLGLAAHLGIDVRWQVDARSGRRSPGLHSLAIGQPQPSKIQIAITERD
jgi:hypothetical protein